MYKWIYVLIASGILCTSAQAQRKLSLSISSQQGENVSYASIILTPFKDSLKRKNAPVAFDESGRIGRIADSSGNAIIPIAQNRYQLRIEAIMYKPKTLDINAGITDTLITVEMIPESQTLENVVVSARKPLMRQEDDKTIVDPENLALASSNAFEVMEKIPGLFVDPDGNIYLNSTSPSAIWINGREQRMSAADVASMLKSLPPNSISSIEIIRSPSARYDASGGGGIVNVILKKNVKLGMAGSINMGMNQGRYGNQFAGFSLNNNSGKLSTNLNMNISARNSFDELDNDRKVTADTVLIQRSYTRFPGSSFYTGFGLTYTINPKWELAADSRVNLNLSKNNNQANSDLVKGIPTNLITANFANISNHNRGTSLAQGFNLKNKLDTLGSEWVNDLSYNFSSGNNEQQLLNLIQFPINFSTTTTGDFSNRSHGLSFQSNLVKKLRKKFTLESGIKTSNLWFTNDTRFYNNGSPTADKRRSNSYAYDEHVHAAYLQGSKTLGKFVLKTGLRVENTNMNGRQSFPTDTAFTLRRTDAFPYIYLSRNLFSIANFELRGYLLYRRTISRPSYGFLNPAIRIIDPYLYETGNPTLRPQFTNNYEANISVDERPIFAFGLNQTRDIFSQVVYQADSNKNLLLRTYDNLGSNKETYFRIIGAIPPGKKYFFVVAIQYNHNLYNGRYEGLPISFNRGSWTAFTYHNLKLSKTTQFSVNGFIRLKGQLQFYELGNFGNLNANISQQFLKKKLTLSVGINDMFYTNKNAFFLQQGTFTTSGFRRADTRRGSINIRYNFGIRKKEEKKGFDLDAERNEQ